MSDEGAKQDIHSNLVSQSIPVWDYIIQKRLRSETLLSQKQEE